MHFVRLASKNLKTIFCKKSFIMEIGICILGCPKYAFYLGQATSLKNIGDIQSGPPALAKTAYCRSTGKFNSKEWIKWDQTNDSLIDPTEAFLKNRNIPEFKNF